MSNDLDFIRTFKKIENEVSNRDDLCNEEYHEFNKVLLKLIREHSNSPSKEFFNDDFVLSVDCADVQFTNLLAHVSVLVSIREKDLGYIVY